MIIFFVISSSFCAQNRVVSTDIICRITNCEFSGMVNSFDGSCVYYSMPGGSFYLSFAFFVDCHNTNTLGISPTYYSLCQFSDCKCIFVQNTESYECPTGYCSASVKQIHSYYSSSFNSADYRGFYNVDGNVSCLMINLTYFHIAYGAVIRMDPITGCSSIYCITHHIVSDCLYNIVGTYTGNHYFQYLGLYNVTLRKNSTILVNTPGRVIVRNAFMCAYRPLGIFSVTYSVLPQIYDSFVEQSAINSNFDITGNVKEVCITHNFPMFFAQCNGKMTYSNRRRYISPVFIFCIIL